jgi:UDP-glucose:(heptosyl)LPS alpha-1,3-glucosyltransferase
MMKVAILSRNFSRSAGGAESYAVQLAEAMRSECDITIISQRFDDSSGYFKYIHVPVISHCPRWINQLWFNWFSRKSTVGRFDVVHSHENVTYADVNTVHVKTVHASLSQKKFGWLKPYLSPRLLAYLFIERKRLCSAGHRNVFVSQLLMDETQAVLPEIQSGVVIPPGVEFPDVPPGQGEKLAARRRLGLPVDKPIIGFIGHDYRKKGLATLLKAVSALPFDVEVVVVGKTDHAGEYQGLVDSLGAGKRCRFLGVLNEMNSIYATIDCLAHPTTQDVFPMVLLEAMANGVPVITTAAPFNSMADLLVDHENALLLHHPSEDKFLSKLIVEVLSDDVLRNNISCKGREFASKYSWDKIKNRYLALYRQLAEISL